MGEAFVPGNIDGVIVTPLKRHVDARGWLAELYRKDQVDGAWHPVMAYLSESIPGQARGPHEHVDQSDLFCFLGPSDFHVRMWDNRAGSATFRRVMDLTAGVSAPASVLIPPGVVHAYRNVGAGPGWVINFPNRLYKGEGYAEPVDEIRHEDDPATPFRFGDIG